MNGRGLVQRWWTASLDSYSLRDDKGIPGLGEHGSADRLGALGTPVLKAENLRPGVDVLSGEVVSETWTGLHCQAQIGAEARGPGEQRSAETVRHIELAAEGSLATVGAQTLPEAASALQILHGQRCSGLDVRG